MAPPVEEAPTKVVKVATTVVRRQSSKPEETKSTTPTAMDDDLHLTVLEESFRNAQSGYEGRSADALYFFTLFWQSRQDCRVFVCDCCNQKHAEWDVVWYFFYCGEMVPNCWFTSVITTSQILKETVFKTLPYCCCLHLRTDLTTGRDEEATFLSSLKSLWRGFIHMHAVAKLVTKAFPVSGTVDNLTEVK